MDSTYIGSCCKFCNNCLCYSVLEIERFTLRKTFITDLISKRRLANFGEENQYYLSDHHEPIVSREVCLTSSLGIGRTTKHKNGDFKVFISDGVQERMVAELQLKKGNGNFEFNTFLNQLNENIPLKIEMHQKVNTLRNNRDVIKEVAINDIDKTVLIGTKILSKGKPQDKTLRKLYMFTEESESIITEFIRNLKKANMTVAWTTEDQRFRVADINSLINSINVKG